MFGIGSQPSNFNSRGRKKLDQPDSWLILVSRVRLPDGANLMQLIRSEFTN